MTHYARPYSPQLGRVLASLQSNRRQISDTLQMARNQIKRQLVPPHAGCAQDTLDLYSRHAAMRVAAGQYRGFLTKLVADAKAAAHPIARRSPECEEVLRTTEEGREAISRIRGSLTLRPNGHTCPVCDRAAHIWGSRITYDACEDCLATGACYAENQWWTTREAMLEALKPVTMWLLSATELSKQEVPQRSLSSYFSVKTEEGMPVTVNGEPVHYKAGSLRMNYHSAHQVGAYNDATSGVGIELEVNAGSHNTFAMENIIGRILLATKHAVKVERDSSVTGFEVISGYGPPAALREKIAPIFANDLLYGFRTGLKTGAHVHVTNPWHVEDNRSISMELALRNLKNGFTQELRDVYEKLAGRAYNQYALHNIGISHYNCLSVREQTVEFRLFKMQLSLAKLMRNTQFAWSVIGSLAQDVTESKDWLTWLADQPREQTFELRAWLAAQGHKVPHVRSEYKKVYSDLGVSSITV